MSGIRKQCPHCRAEVEVNLLDCDTGNGPWFMSDGSGINASGEAECPECGRALSYSYSVDARMGELEFD